MKKFFLLILISLFAFNFNVSAGENPVEKIYTVNQYIDGELVAISTFDGKNKLLSKKFFNGLKFTHEDFYRFDEKTPKTQRVFGETEDIFVEKIFSFNGLVVSETRYEFGEKNGFQKIYDPNGTLRSSCYYLDGKRHGDVCYYNEHGQLWRIDSYDDGTLVATTSWLASLSHGVEKISLQQ